VKDSLTLTLCARYFLAKLKQPHRRLARERVQSFTSHEKWKEATRLENYLMSDR